MVVKLTQGPKASRFARRSVDPLEDKVRDMPTFQGKRIEV
jgi:hypothetical protein